MWMMWKKKCAKPSWDEEVMDGQSSTSNPTQNHTKFIYFWAEKITSFWDCS